MPWSLMAPGGWELPVHVCMHVCSLVEQEELFAGYRLLCSRTEQVSWSPGLPQSRCAAAMPSQVQGPLILILRDLLLSSILACIHENSLHIFMRIIHVNYDVYKVTLVMMSVCSRSEIIAHPSGLFV